jgi:ubiquinone/menaquinone biosynthesis C-methylase UbiE
MTHSGTALIDPNKIFEKIQINAGERVADFGCGRTGHVVYLLAPMVGEKGVVYAVDIMKDVLESIKSQALSAGLANIQTVWSDVETEGAAAIPDESLDAGFFVNVFFMLKNRDRALREAARLIKPDGYLAVIDWQRKVGPLGPSETQMVNQDELAILADKAGFESFDKVVVGEYHFCRIFKKKN